MKYRDMRAEYIRLKIEALDPSSAKDLLTKVAEKHPEAFIKLLDGKLCDNDLLRRAKRVYDEAVNASRSPGFSGSSISPAITTIKFIRQTTNWGLKESKDFYDQSIAGR